MYAFAYMVTDTVIPEKTVCRLTRVVVVVLVHVGYCLFLLFIIIIIIIIICYAIFVVGYCVLYATRYIILYFGTFYCVRRHLENPFLKISFARKNLSE